MGTESVQASEESSAIPMVPALMGYGGLIPFVAAGLGVWTPEFSELARHALVAYGAIILSFVGAVHWGLALAGGTSGCRDKLFMFSVCPALLGWVALLMSTVLALPVLMAGFVGTRLVELKACGPAIPAWYPRLRNHLTAGALISLATGWLAVL